MKKERVKTSINMPKEWYIKLKLYENGNGRTVGKLVRDLLESYMEENSVEINGFMREILLNDNVIKKQGRPRSVSSI